MKQFLATLQISTQRKRELVDITERVREEVRRSAVSNGICALYAQGATAALMIQENDDPNITLDVLDCLEGIAPAGPVAPRPSGRQRFGAHSSRHRRRKRGHPHPGWQPRVVDLAEYLPMRLRRPASTPNRDCDDSGRVIHSSGGYCCMTQAISSAVSALSYILTSSMGTNKIPIVVTQTSNPERRACPQRDCTVAYRALAS